jgi:hypothetical protein
MADMGGCPSTPAALNDKNSYANHTRGGRMYRANVRYLIFYRMAEEN